jgi:hypothetical protein
MKITNTKEYRDALHAIKEFESNFDPEINGEECYILTNTASSAPPIVILDETVADKMYVESGNYTMVKGVIVGLDRK